jgi:hypothetical protein
MPRSGIAAGRPTLAWGSPHWRSDHPNEVGVRSDPIRSLTLVAGPVLGGLHLAAGAEARATDGPSNEDGVT